MDPSTSETRLRATLHAYADRAMADRDVWPDLARAIRLDPQAARTIRITPSPAPLLVAGGLLLLLVLAVGLVPGVRKDGLRQAINTATAAPSTPSPWAAGPLVQARDGYTITIQPISADLNHIVISYTMTSLAREVRVLYPLLRRGADYTPSLQTPNGQILPWYSGYGSRGLRYSTTQPPPPEESPITSSAFMMFDTAAAGDLPDSLQLDLTIPVGRVVTDIPTTQTIAPHSPITDIINLPFGGTQQVTQQPVLPFHFQFAMPLDRRRRIAEVNQTITQQGVAITLDRAVVTASEARITLHGAVLDDPRLQVPLPYLRLHIEYEFWVQHPNADATAPSTFYQNGDGPWTYSYLGSLLAKNNDWAFYVQNVTEHDPRADSSVADTPVPGLWTFHFTVPPLAAP
ncbi:MAG: hypothetical protein M3Z04_07720 [Chloroflexota bacterium]|nr:hypothetical protein [Chloroflexota bacterium]